MASERAFDSARHSLAANLVRLRARRHWSQQQAADAIGIDLKHYQKLEYGTLNPGLRTLVAAAGAFEVTVGSLLRRAALPKKRPVGRPVGPAR
jgi:transcriptional regulator with XRE-family HTH domain